jgi:hypothetical protein
MSGSNKIKLSGRISLEKMLKGSKSEHAGYVLQTADARYKLRRKGGNPFQDDYFKPYNNKSVRVEGIVLNNQFFVEKIELEGK